MVEILATVIIREEDKYLLFKGYKGMWTFLEEEIENEEIEEGLKRELYEVLDIKALSLRLDFCNCNEPCPHAIYLLTDYLGEIKEKRPLTHSDLTWFTLDEMTKLKNVRKNTKALITALTEQQTNDII